MQPLMTGTKDQQHASADERSSIIPSVVLINVFEVPEGRDKEFLQGWEAAREFMQHQPGYISTRLHQSLDPTARFRFINVAEWASPADFRAALSQPEFVKMQQGMPFVNFPSLYQVVRA